jgi:hypothetical protein
MRKFLLGALALTSLAASGGVAVKAQPALTTPTVAQGDWTVFRVGDILSYRAPPETEWAPLMESIDWYAARFRAHGFWYDIQYGDLGDVPGQFNGSNSRYKISNLTIDGKPATIITGRADRELTFDCRSGYFTFLYIGRGVNALEAYGCAPSAAALPRIQAIFESVRFDN